MMDLGALLKTKNAGTESLLKCATAECVHKCDTETISQIWRGSELPLPQRFLHYFYTFMLSQ